MPVLPGASVYGKLSAQEKGHWAQIETMSAQQQGKMLYKLADERDRKLRPGIQGLTSEGRDQFIDRLSKKVDSSDADVLRTGNKELDDLAYRGRELYKPTRGMSGYYLQKWKSSDAGKRASSEYAKIKRREEEIRRVYSRYGIGS